MTGADILVECLKAQGVKAIFGMPGTQNVYIYDALLRKGEGIKRVLIRHEQSATFLADGYARSKGEVGVALTVPGPGATNASTGIGEAYTDSIPVLLITGQSDSKIIAKNPYKLFHGLDQLSFFKPITKFCARPKAASEIPHLVEKAFHQMLNGRPGPAMLEFTSDVLTQEAEATITIPKKVALERSDGDSLEISKAAVLLNESKLPLILVGGAAIWSGAEKEVKQLSELLDAPVSVTRLGKGVISEDDPKALSNLNGKGGRKAFEIADLILSVGCRFTSIDSRGWSLKLPPRHIQVDPDSEELGKEYPVDIGICGDVKSVLCQLIDELKTIKSKLHASQLSRSSLWKEHLPQIHQEVINSPKPPILAEMREILAPDAIVSVDVHSIGYRAFAEFPVYMPRCFLYPCIYVALGYAFPASLGAKVAFPDRQVVCFSGDGGFLMGAMELATAVQYKINVVSVVVSDNCLTAIKGTQEQMCDGRSVDIEIQNPDFVKFAESFGAVAYRANGPDEFKLALREALKCEVPSLIELPMKDKIKELIAGIPWLPKSSQAKIRV